ncbi:hypothetical protein [Amphibiibacter pelophylacis]|uniref:Uncharacterized protein n=1 Tax=Amphibiibacter pelophylacis TaxID=1799477 RepID=A0ACC6P098_9BURK
MSPPSAPAPRRLVLLLAALTLPLFTGCTVLAVADAVASTAVTVTSTVVKTGVKAVGGAVDMVTPGDE